jgi:hypothetical protein
MTSFTKLDRRFSGFSLVLIFNYYSLSLPLLSLVF